MQSEVTMSEKEYEEACARYEGVKDAIEGDAYEEKLWLVWAIRKYERNNKIVETK